MKQQLIGVLAILTIILSVSCASKNSKIAITESVVDSVNQEMMHLEDSISSTWKVMIDEDNTKLQLMKRLIDEISYTKTYDQATYDSLDQSIAALRALRYDQTSMQQSSLIDQYDNQTREVVNQVIAFANNHPLKSEYPIIDELIEEIRILDNQVIYRRVDYDNSAVTYNKYIEENQEIISKTGKVPTPRPLFQLTE